MVDLLKEIANQQINQIVWLLCLAIISIGVQREDSIKQRKRFSFEKKASDELFLTLSTKIPIFLIPICNLNDKHPCIISRSAILL